MTISIKPTASGATIEQDGSTILSVDGSGNLTVANDLTVTGTPPSIDALSTASGSAPSYSVRAWVLFNGTGTVSITGSGNVSSITDGGVGTYTVNYTTELPSGYAWVGSTGRNADPIVAGTGNVRSTTYTDVSTGYHNGSGGMVDADVDSVSFMALG